MSKSIKSTLLSLYIFSVMSMGLFTFDSKPANAQQWWCFTGDSDICEDGVGDWYGGGYCCVYA